jgi:hypothetical protein
MAPPRGPHLGVVLYIRAVGVVEGAGAVLAALAVAVTLLAAVLGQLHGAARKVAEEVEGFAEGVLGGASECTRRVHSVACIAERKRSDSMVRGEKGKMSCTGRYEAVLLPGGFACKRWTLARLGVLWTVRPHPLHASTPTTSTNDYHHFVMLVI